MKGMRLRLVSGGGVTGQTGQTDCHYRSVSGDDTARRHDTLSTALSLRTCPNLLAYLYLLSLTTEMALSHDDRVATISGSASGSARNFSGSD